MWTNVIQARRNKTFLKGSLRPVAGLRNSRPIHKVKQPSPGPPLLWASRLKLAPFSMCKFRFICRGAVVILIWNGFFALARVYHSHGTAANVQSIHDTLAQDGDTITIHPLRSPQPTATPSPTPCPLGVFSLTGAGRPVANGVLSNPNVDGVSIRLHWNELEPADGVYNWAYLDTQAARVVAAGKYVSLRIGTGQGDSRPPNNGNVPSWVIDEITAAEGGTPNDCQHYFHFNNPPVADQAIPKFWSPVFVQKRREMLTALGAHFANNPNIKVVFVGACNAKSSDWSVPDSAAVDGICGPGQSERSRWLGLGYTSQKLIDQACPATGTGGVIDAAALAFPNAFIAYAVGRNSGLDPTQDYAAEHITQNARAKYGNRVLIAKETLSQRTYENDPYNQQPADNGWTIMWELPPCAAQMDSDVTSASGLARMSGQRDGGPVQVLTDAVNVGSDYGTFYQEIYQDDITNQQLAGVIAYAHGLLACSSPTPTPTPTPTSTPTPTATPTVTPSPTPTPGGITLTASGRRVQGRHTVDLSWSESNAANIDIYRDGVVIATVPNNGAYKDFIGVRGGNVRYTYKVCDAGTTNCSNEVTVRFGGPPL